MKVFRVFPLAVFVILLAAGCGGAPALAPVIADQPASQEPVQVVPSQTALPNPIEKTPVIPASPGAPEMTTPLSPDKFIQLVKQDLAARLKTDAGQISTVKAMEMTWPDAALGCPQPGKVYAQGLVPGLKIWLEANDTQYIYHTDLTGQFVLCPSQNPDEIVPGSTPGPEIGVPIK